jgi:uncharacterized membrane protein
MAKLERSIVIKGTVVEIESITNDIDRMPEWYSGVTKATTDGVFPDAGGTVVMTYKAAGLTFEMSQTSLEYEYGKGGKYKLEGMIAGNYEEFLEPLENGTRYTMKFDYNMPGGGVGKVVDKLIVERMNAKQLEDSLKNLKRLVEVVETVDG